MRWQDFIEMQEHLPTTAEYYNSVVRLILANLNSVQPRDRGKNYNARGEQIFLKQLNQLIIDDQNNNDSIDLKPYWFKLFVLLAKQLVFLKHGQFYKALVRGMTAASENIAEKLGARAQQFGLQNKSGQLIKELTRGIDAIALAKNWLIKQKVIYLLLSLYRQIEKSGKPVWQQYRDAVGRLIEMAVYTDFKGDYDDIEEQIKGKRQLDVSPFYANLSALVADSGCTGPFAALVVVQELVQKDLFKKNNQRDIYNQRVIDMTTRWRIQLQKMKLPWLWRHINRHDLDTVEALSSRLRKYNTHQQHVYDRSAQAWLRHLSTYTTYLESCLWPPLQKLLLNQIDECVRDVVLHLDLKYESLIYLYGLLPAKSKQASAVLLSLIKSFSSATTKQKLAMLRTACQREEATSKVNYHLQELFKTLQRCDLTDAEKASFHKILDDRNRFIRSRQQGIFKLFRKKELQQLFEPAELIDFIKGIASRVHISDAHLQQKLAPYQANVTDEDYRLQLRDRFQTAEDRITHIEKKKMDAFNEVVAMCQGDDAYLQAVKKTLPQAVIAQVGEPITEQELMRLPNAGVLLRQSMNAMRDSLEDETSEISRTFSDVDIQKLQKIIQHFDNLEQIEDEKMAIMGDPILEMFYANLQRRLSGMWMASHVISTNDITIQANAAARWTNSAAQIGGGLVSLPVISGLISASGKSLEVADQFRKYDNYMRLQDLTPSGTSAEVFAEMIARIITLRYAQQIAMLTRSGAEQFAEYSYYKIRGGLLAQQGLSVPETLDYDDMAVMSQQQVRYDKDYQNVYRHAYAIAQLLSRPIDDKRFAVDSKTTLNVYKRLTLKSRRHKGQRVWRAEDLLLKPDLVCNGQLYRSPYAEPMKGHRRRLANEYGHRLASSHEISRFQCQCLGPVDGADDAVEMQQLPPSVQRMLVNLEARTQFALQRSLQASDRVAQANGHHASPSKIMPAPAVFTEAVDEVVPDTPMKAIPGINAGLQASYQQLLTQMPGTPVQPARAVDADDDDDQLVQDDEAAVVVQTPKQKAEQKVPATPAQQMMAAPQTPIQQMASPKTPFGNYTLRRYTGTHVVGAGEHAYYRWPTAEELARDITALRQEYKEKRAPEKERGDKPGPETIQLRERLYQKMWSWCLLETQYNVDQAIFLFNHRCGFKGEVLTPDRMLRENMTREQALSQKLNPQALFYQPQPPKLAMQATPMARKQPRPVF